MLVYKLCVVQAEDGIRERDVTGVQTCALPISRLDDHATAHAGIFRHVGFFDDFLIPLGEVGFAGEADGGLFGLALGLIGHGST